MRPGWCAHAQALLDNEVDASPMRRAGVQYPLEAQIISAIPQAQLPACPSEGCQVGTSVMFALEDDPTLINAFLDSAIPYIPYNGAVRLLCLPTRMTVVPGALAGPCSSSLLALPAQAGAICGADSAPHASDQAVGLGIPKKN